ncbi:MAG: CBS domain-containing protein [Thermincola sp.]|jgi:acetoin utilization protein AcuB|nr:CBS domain-containing protein [Thermincola sp.]MDT3704248.1 CBS domain-containing protein [Thermincola sp.]
MYVRQFMVSQVITVSPDQTIVAVMALMKEKRIRRCPVVEKGKLVGFITDGDLRAVTPSPASTLSIWELNHLIEKTTIREVALKKVVTCRPDTRLEDAASLMTDHKITGLPVVEDDKLVGIITLVEIVGAFLDVMGSRSPGKRVVIEAKDQIGVISDLGLATKENDVNIASLAVFHRSENRVRILVHLDGDRVAEVEAALEKKGYQITK